MPESSEEGEIEDLSSELAGDSSERLSAEFQKEDAAGVTQEDMKEQDKAEGAQKESVCGAPGSQMEQGGSGNVNIPVSWEDACVLAGIEEDIAVRPPAEYVPSKASVGDEEGEPPLQYTWSTGEHTLCLRLAGTDSSWPGDRELRVLNPADWENCLPEPDGDGGLRFAILFESGLRLEYEGWLTQEELEELFRELPDS